VSFNTRVVTYCFISEDVTQSTLGKIQQQNNTLNKFSIEILLVFYAKSS